MSALTATDKLGQVFGAGDTVRKTHVHDGTKRGGTAAGPMLLVLEVRHHRPVDGPGEPNAVIELSDGTWEFPWNLQKEASCAT